MKKVMKEIEVYTLDEVKDKALDKNRYINVEDIDWWEDTIDNWTGKLAEKGFEDADIYFSGFYSQGDGACFDCKKFDLKKLLNLVEIPEEKKKIILKCDEKFGIELEINRKSCLYSHEHSVYLDWSSSGSIPSICCNMIDDFVKELEKIRVELCKQIYADLKDDYECLTSDEHVEDTLEANEYEFLADGTIYC